MKRSSPVLMALTAALLLSQAPLASQTPVELDREPVRTHVEASREPTSARELRRSERRAARLQRKAERLQRRLARSHVDAGGKLEGKEIIKQE